MFHFVLTRRLTKLKDGPTGSNNVLVKIKHVRECTEVLVVTKMPGKRPLNNEIYLLCEIQTLCEH